MCVRLRTQAPRRGVRDVAELLGGGADGGTRRLTDPGVVLEGARRGRLGRPGEPGDVREDDPTFGRVDASGSAQLADVARGHRSRRTAIAPTGRWKRPHIQPSDAPPLRAASSGLCNRLRGR